MLAGGGTGGHVYPALSVADALPARAGEPVESLLAGTRRGNGERLAADAGVPFAEVRAAPVRGRSPLALVRSAAELAAGTAQAWRLIDRFRPDAVLATGGYATVPVVLAARCRRVPVVVYLPDVYPGWAVTLSVRLATRVATTTEAARRHLPRGKTAVTGYPVRAAFFATDRAAARYALGVAAGESMLLVTGASQGSHVINEAVFAALPVLLPRCVVLHQTGAADHAVAQRVAERLPAEQRCRYRPVAYLDHEDMPRAMAAADLAVMRAGASSLAEPPAARLPAVLVPASYAGAHQAYNARYMAERGAAVMLEEGRLDELSRTVIELLDDRSRLAKMAAAAGRLATPDAARRIADVVLEAVA